MTQHIPACVLLASTMFLSSPVVAQTQNSDPPKVADQAQDFELQAAAGSLQGKVTLAESLKKGPVVLVVLRGYPGYQCPICSRQVSSLVRKAAEFQKAGASVLMVYPGETSELDKRAKEFLKGSELPEPFTLLIDPNYKFTNAYHLRWEAPKETAYPSTFVIDSTGKIRFAKISHSHGDRSAVDEVLAALN